MSAVRMDRTGVPQSFLLQLFCSASLCLCNLAPPAPSQIYMYSPQSECSLRVEPPKLVVRFGDPVSVNCSNPQGKMVGWINILTQEGIKLSYVLWTEESLSSWSLEPICYAMSVVGQCHVSLPVTVFQPPQRVSVSFRNHSGPLLEDQYSLQCEVEAVAPAQNMTVAFYRGSKNLSFQSSSSAEKSPVNESFSLVYNVSREDHGVQFWCEARLELGPEGPQPPLVVRSQNITANVQFSEEQVEAPPTGSSREEAGRSTVSVQSHQGQRQPSGEQNPQGGGHAPGSSTLVLLALLILQV